ncbi:phosphate permease [Athelia psychrophila]|uniref:Phosphate permease n=1 Tax=Athelia psychrophila TaxID=1759441 RepID=A0A166NKV2_9AGAM|nr:phosphate permease [Fibularhizoctonia sp. CBS 109695]
MLLFRWFHVKVVLVAGVGFFTDAYDLFAISIASIMIGLVYGVYYVNALGSHLQSLQDLGIKVAAPAGTLVGQLLFGWLADIVGRKRMYGIELMLMIVATFGQAVSGGSLSVNVIGVLIVWRFVMGLGIGGDYPLSAVITSEFASTRTRGRLMTAVFAAQGWGTFAGPLIGWVVVTAFRRHSVHGDNFIKAEVDAIWRLIIGLGCVPAAIALYFRLTIPETPRFTMDIEHNVKQAQDDMRHAFHDRISSDHSEVEFTRIQAPSFGLRDFIAYFSRWKNLKVLIATSYSWFALDIAFYGLGLNNGLILTKLIPYSSSIGDYLSRICIGNLLISLPLIPGSYVCFFFIDSWGRKPIQLMGFTVLSIIFLIMGAAYAKLTKDTGTPFIVLYCVANFFQNFGPNTTTFIVPGEAFPTRYRSTAHGISAACGKLGAIIAQVAFSYLTYQGANDAETSAGPKRLGTVLIAFAFVMLTGVLSTLLLTETMQKPLELLSHDDGFMYGVTGRGEEVADLYEDHVPLSASR